MIPSDLFLNLSSFFSDSSRRPHHPQMGIISNPADYQQFVKGINSGDVADFVATPLGPPGNTSRLGR